MMLSEKASAFFIENLISAAGTVESAAKKSKLESALLKDEAYSTNNRAGLHFPACDSISAFITCSSKSASNSSLSSSFSSILNSPLFNESSKSIDANTQLYVSRKLNVDFEKNGDLKLTKNFR